MQKLTIPLLFLITTSTLATNINVKFINESDFGVRANIGDEIAVFGIATQPIIYASIPVDTETPIALTPMVADSEIKAALIEHATQSTSATISTIRSGMKLVKLSKDAAEEAAILQKELFLRARHLKEIDSRPFVEAAANIKMTDEAIKIAKNAKLTMKLGLADIGLTGLDWLLSKGTVAQSLALTPVQIDGYTEDSELVIYFNNERVHYEFREKPIEQKSIKCTILSQKNRRVACCYIDADGDTIRFTLDKNHFSSGEIDVSKYESEVVIYKVQDPNDNIRHNSTTIVKGLINAGSAVVDPIPVTKVMSGASALHSLYMGTQGLVRNFTTNVIQRFNLTSAGNIQITDTSIRKSDGQILE
ncbi:MAG: hypothetical protein AB8C84_13445 [Oligoflexales bacterium]